jgi:hypothetical protein
VAQFSPGADTRSSISVIFSACAATAPKVRRRYGNSFNGGERISVSRY